MPHPCEICEVGHSSTLSFFFGTYLTEFSNVALKKLLIRPISLLVAMREKHMLHALLILSRLEYHYVSRQLYKVPTCPRVQQGASSLACIFPLIAFRGEKSSSNHRAIATPYDLMSKNRSSVP